MIGEPRISAIVCTYRRYESLAESLDSLLTQTVGPADREIIVVDNSLDQAAHAAFAWPRGVRVVVSGRAGLSGARNLGVRHACGEIVAFIDDDATAEPDWLAAVLDAFAADADGSIAAVGGPVLPVWDAARPEWLDTWHEGFLSLVDLGDTARAIGPGEWLAGTNIAFRRAVLDPDDAFAERLGRCPQALLGNEEIAVLARLHACGFTIRYDPAMVVRHRVASDRLTHAWQRRRIAWQAVSDLLVATPDDGAESALALWRRVTDYLARLPPAWRGPAGLLRDTDDPRLFRAQGEAIAALLRLLLESGESGEVTVLAHAVKLFR